MNDLSLEEALYERLDPVVRRDLWLRRLRGSALVLIAAGTAALLLSAIEERTGWGGPAPWGVLLIATIVALVLVQHQVLQRAPDLRALARMIERVHPELRALLLTAVTEATGADQGRFGYLQEQVIREAVERADARVWSRAVPRARLWAMGAATGGAAVLFVTLAATGIFPGLASLWPDAYGLTVTPGNADAERGTTLVVLARFARQLPSRATLILRPHGRAPVRVEMTRTLGDPLFGGVTPPLDGRTEYQIEYAGHRSRRYRIETFTVPQIERIDAKIVYPGQPGLAAHEVQDARRLSVAQGARVTVAVHFDQAVSRAELISDDGVTIHLAGQRSTVGTATFDPDRPRHYDVQLADPRGNLHRVAAGLTVDVRGNEAPRIALSFPGRDVRVSPLEEVTLEAKVSDDVALVSYGVSYGIGGRLEREVPLGGGRGDRTATAQLVVPLETLGAEPGDLLVYHFWAEDVAADGARRRVASDMYFAEVRPFEEAFRETAGAGGGQGGGGPAEELSRRQKEVINATWRLEREAREGTTARGLESDVAVVQKGQAEVKKTAESLRLEPLPREQAGALDLALDAMTRALAQLGEALSGSPASGLESARGSEQSAYAALLRMSAREHQVARGRSGQGAPAAEESDRQLDELDLKQKDSRYETRSEAAAQDQNGRENRQVLSRLRELAERQRALTERLKDLKLALSQARSDEKDELERRLKRLRDEQQEMLGDLDELMERLDRPENRSRLAEARNALEETRARAGEASQALAEGDTSRALGAGTRAERALDKVREDLQRRVASGFGDEMRGLRDDARKLAEDQRKLGEGLARGASGPTESRRLAEAVRRQKAAANALLEKMRRLTEESEPSAPLLSRKLYDAVRQAKTDGLESSLDRMGDLLDQNLAPQAGVEEGRARQAVADLDQGVGAAARGVLGDQGEALRLARGEIEALLDQAGREGRSGGAPGSDGPVTGEGFGAFADRLRDVGELLDEPQWRAQTARVLERTRTLRAEWKRHGEKPRWDLFEEEVVKPLGELRDRVGEELRRVTPDRERLAPIDRDPVPSRFTDLVRRYYKSLAGE
jgi:hypothetical protein